MNLDLPTEIFAFLKLKTKGKNALAAPISFAIFSYISQRAIIEPL